MQVSRQQCTCPQMQKYHTCVESSAPGQSSWNRCSEQAGKNTATRAGHGSPMRLWQACTTHCSTQRHKHVEKHGMEYGLCRTAPTYFHGRTRHTSKQPASIWPSREHHLQCSASGSLSPQSLHPSCTLLAPSSMQQQGCGNTACLKQQHCQP